MDWTLSFCSARQARTYWASSLTFACLHKLLNMSVLHLITFDWKCNLKLFRPSEMGLITHSLFRLPQNVCKLQATVIVFSEWYCVLCYFKRMCNKIQFLELSYYDNSCFEICIWFLSVDYYFSMYLCRYIYTHIYTSYTTSLFSHANFKYLSLTFR